MKLMGCKSCIFNTVFLSIRLIMRYFSHLLLISFFYCSVLYYIVLCVFNFVFYYEYESFNDVILENSTRFFSDGFMWGYVGLIHFMNLFIFKYIMLYLFKICYV